MTFLKWICFIIVCTDTVSYIVEKSTKQNILDNKEKMFGAFLGQLIGIAARVFVLYGTATYWLLV